MTQNILIAIFGIICSIFYNGYKINLIKEKYNCSTWEAFILL